MLNVSAALDLKARVLTAFVKDSPVANFIKGELHRRNIIFEESEIRQDSP